MQSGIPQAVHLLKQENSQLKDRVAALEQENEALQAFIEGIFALHDASITYASQDNLLQVLDEILYQALVVTNAEHGSLLLIDNETDELVFVLVHGDFRDSLQGYRMNKHQGIAGWVVKHGEPLLVNHTGFDPRFSKEVDTKFGLTSENILAVPLTGDDKTLGVIELVNKHDGQEFDQSDATLLSLLGVFAATSLEQIERQLDNAE